MNEMENAVDTIIIRLDQAEERNCELKDRSFEIIQSEGNKEKKMKKSEENLCELRIPLRGTIYELLESQRRKEGERGEKREKWEKSLLKEIMAENLQI